MTPTKFRPRVVPILLIVISAFLPTVAAGLFAMTPMLEQRHPRPSWEQSIGSSEQEWEVTAPGEYYLVPDQFRALDIRSFAECQFTTPTGAPTGERADYGYRVSATEPGTYGVTCVELDYSIAVHDEVDAVEDFFRIQERIARYIIVAIGCLILTPVLFVVGLVMTVMATARRRQVFGGRIPTKGTTLLVTSTLVGALLCPPAFILSQLDMEYGRPPSATQIWGHGLTAGLALVTFCVAMIGLARIGQDTARQNAYARNAGLLWPDPRKQQGPGSGPPVPPGSVPPPAPPRQHPSPPPPPPPPPRFPPPPGMPGR